MYAKKQENIAYRTEQNKFPETIPEVAQMLDLLKEDFKIAILNMLKN